MNEQKQSERIVFPPSWSGLRVVLSHDWLTGMRGGERVLELLCRGFPKAPLFSLIYNPAAISAVINDHPIQTTWLQRVPGIFHWYRYFLPFFPGAIERLQAPEADLLISTSHCIAKGLRPPPGARHLCYCFTPMRYAWLFYEEYFGTSSVKKKVMQPILTRLRDWDRRASDRVDRFVTLSRHVRERIRKFYGRDAEVVYPPVRTEFFTPADVEPGGFDLIVSALVPYKCLDLAVHAYNRLGYPLKIVGTGTEYAALRRIARPHIEFLGWLTDEQIRALYRRCRLLIFPGEEDFGIVPVEAQACGRPVVALGRGGVLESVAEPDTGVFFHQQTIEALLAAVETAAARRWNPAVIRGRAEQFNVQRFIDEMDRQIRACLAGKAAMSGRG